MKGQKVDLKKYCLKTLNLGRNIDIQLHESQNSVNRINAKTMTPDVLQKYRKSKTENFESIKRKVICQTQGNPVSLPTNLSAETLLPGESGMIESSPKR